MKTLKELITNEIIERIESALSTEAKLMENKIINAIIYDDYSEVELLVSGVSNDYFQIPIVELEEEISKVWQFIIEEKFSIVPNLAFTYSDSSQTSRITVTDFFTTSDLDNVTDNQYEEFQLLLNELREIYDELRIGIKVEFESVENKEGHENEELLRVIDIYEGW